MSADQGQAQQDMLLSELKRVGDQQEQLRKTVSMAANAADSKGQLGPQTLSMAADAADSKAQLGPETVSKAATAEAAAPSAQAHTPASTNASQEKIAGVLLTQRLIYLN